MEEIGTVVWDHSIEKFEGSSKGASPGKTGWLPFWVSQLGLTGLVVESLFFFHLFFPLSFWRRWMTCRRTRTSQLRASSFPPGHSGLGCFRTSGTCKQAAQGWMEMMSEQSPHRARTLSAGERAR